MLPRQQNNMDRHIPILINTPLFKDISAGDAADILARSGAYTARYQKGEEIISEGDVKDAVGVLLRGEAWAERTDLSGRRFVMARVSPGGVFGDIMAAGGRKSPVTVTAAETLEALFIPAGFIFDKPGRDCEGHSVLLRNILGEIADKYFELQTRINCLTKPTLREKTLFYLSAEVKRQEKPTVAVPFDRETMAGYLNADRSALSRELSAMKRDGLIDYHKNIFRLKGNPYE